MEKLKPCPRCQTAWLYASTGDYYSGYESYGYKVKCECGYAYLTSKYHPTEEEAIEAWNRGVSKNGET